MSNDVSYVIKVVDDFSANLKKFQTGITQVNQSAINSAQILDKSAKSSKFFTQNLIDLGKAAGIYFGAQQITSFAKGVFQTRIEMDGLQASLAAIMPKFDKTKSGTQLAAEEIEYLRAAADRMGISFQAAAPEYMKFLASSKTDLATTRKTFEAFSGLSRLYGLTPQRFGLVINALQQIQGKSRVMMEELKLQLGDSLPNAMNLFAEAAGVSSAEFYKLVGQGRIGSGILRMVAENIEKKFGKDMIAAAQTLGGRTAVLSNQWYYLKTVLSDLVAPTLSSTVSGLAKLTSGAVNFFEAVRSDDAMGKLSEEMRVLAYGARIVADAFRAMGDAYSNLSKLGSGFWNLFKDVVHVAEAGLFQAYGATEMVAGAVLPMGGKELAESGRNKVLAGGDVFQNIIAKNQQRYFAQPEVNITINKAAPDTTVEVQAPRKTNARTGNTVGGTD